VRGAYAGGAVEGFLHSDRSYGIPSDPGCVDAYSPGGIRDDEQVAAVLRRWVGYHVGWVNGRGRGQRC
jgi:hypothetical protein